MRTIVFVLSIVVVSPVAAQDRKRPVPVPLERKEREKEIKELYKADYTKKSAADRKAFAAKLLKQGAEEEDGTTRYVLLDEARRIAARNGDSDTALRAVKETSRRFHVDILALREETTSALTKSLSDVPAAVELTEHCFDLVLDAVRADRYRLAADAGASAASAARRSGDKWLQRRARETKSGVKAIEREFKKLAPMHTKLLESPDDPDANLAVGRFLCFYKGEWTKGLPLLAKASDADLEAVANLELDPSASAEGRMKVANAWLERGRKAKSPVSDILLARASRLYRNSFADLRGVNRARVTRGMEKIAEEGIGGPGWGNADRAVRFPRGTAIRVSSFRYDGSHPLTLEAVVRTGVPDEKYGGIIANSEKAGFFLGTYRNSWYFSHYAGRSLVPVRAPRPLTPHRRTHVAAVLDGKTARLYIDGKLQHSANVKAKLTPGRDLLIGADPNGDDRPGWSFSGLIDDVRISRVTRYTRNFTPPDLLMPDEDTMLLFDFDQEKGSQVRDISGNGHHGTMVGAKRVKARL